MTESEWLACEDPDDMLRFLDGTMSWRKKVLFCVACCRRLDEFLSDYGRQQLAVLERSANRALSSKKKSQMYNDAMASADSRSYQMGSPEGCARWLAATTLYFAISANCGGTVYNAARAVQAAQSDPDTFDLTKPGPPMPGNAAELVAHAQMLRCIVAPFRPKRRQSLPWRSITVLSIANEIHDNHSFDHLPILADALEDAGCDDADILSHLRGGGPHTRGCWPIDRILNRS